MIKILSQFIGKLCFSKTYASVSYDEYGSSIITENTIPLMAKMGINNMTFLFTFHFIIPNFWLKLDLSFG